MFTPFHSFCGGLTIAGAVHELLVETGLVFGISGFFHRMTGALTRSISRKPAKHEKDAASATSNNDAVALAAIVGLVTGGVLLRIWLSEAERAFGVPIFDPPYHASFRASALAGFLQGYGTRLAAGCTSGHFICGTSRLSKRSIIATATFMATAVATVQIIRAFGYSPTGPISQDHTDWSYPDFKWVMAGQIPSLLSFMLARTAQKPNQLLRSVIGFLCGLQFSFGLALAGLLQPSKVVGFLTFPSATTEWDPSLALMAVGSLVPGLLSYLLLVKPKLDRGTPPTLDTKWSIPSASEVDLKLLIGSVIFGLGWGANGMCPGPAIISLTSGAITGFTCPVTFVMFLGSAAIGGLIAS